MPEDQLFYVGQKAIIEKDGRVLVLFDEVLGADLPGGKIQVGELDFGAALAREVLEETGLIVKNPKPFEQAYFSFTPEMLKKSSRKTNLVFVPIFTVQLVSGDVKLSNEHVDFKWIGPDDLGNLFDTGGVVTKTLTRYFAAKK